jgi:hypothetical protein
MSGQIKGRSIAIFSHFHKKNINNQWLSFHCYLSQAYPENWSQIKSKHLIN